MSVKSVEEIDKDIREQEGILRALESDLNSKSYETQIALKQQEIEKLQKDIESIKQRRERLPTAIEACEQSIRRLRMARVNAASSKDVNKLMAMIERAKKQGIDVQALLNSKTE